jgi:hypothetical protein
MTLYNPYGDSSVYQEQTVDGFFYPPSMGGERWETEAPIVTNNTGDVWDYNGTSRMLDANPLIPGWQSPSSNPLEFFTGGVYEYDDSTLAQEGWAGTIEQSLEIVTPNFPAWAKYALIAGVVLAGLSALRPYATIASKGI